MSLTLTSAPYIQYHRDVVQGSDEWRALRCGVLTASEMHLIVTPTLKAASNDKERSHLYELLAQRITRYVEPRYISDDMLRGQAEEIEARALYVAHYAPVAEVGFITNSKWGFTIGYSPDGLVGDRGLIECKSRRQKFQVETVLFNVEEQTIPQEFCLQLQTGLLVSEREWIDFISYSGGLPLVRVRVFPIPAVQDAILTAARSFEDRMAGKMAKYREIVGAHPMIETERRVEVEMFL